MVRSDRPGPSPYRDLGSISHWSGLAKDSRPVAGRLGAEMIMKHQQNPVRGRLNAWLFRILDSYMDAKYGALKRRLFAELPDTVVEIGAGSGANCRYLRRGTLL